MADIVSPKFTLKPKDTVSFVEQKETTFANVARKLINGEELTPSEISFLKGFKSESEEVTKGVTKGVTKEVTDADIQNLQKYLKMSGNVADTTDIVADMAGDLDLDMHPTKSVDPGRLADKQKNFKLELQAFQKKMSDVFGKNYDSSQMKARIDKVIAALVSTASADDFQTAVKSELKDRTATNPALDSLSNAELNLIARGTVDRVFHGDLLPETSDVEIKPTEGDLNTRFTEDSSVQEWISHLDYVKESVPAADQYKVEYLLRKMENLEELDSSDSDAMRSFLQLKAREITDTEVETNIKDFNSKIQGLRDLKPTDDLSGLGVKLKNNILANNAKLLTAADVNDSAALVAARNLLDGPSAYNPKNSSLVELEKIYNKKNNDDGHVKLPDDLNERKQFLKTYLEKMCKTEQGKHIDDKHYSKADPELVFEDFKNQVLFLSDYIFTDSKTPRERELLQDDLIRFARGEEASEDLLKAFGKGTKDDQTDKLKALNFMDRGSGSSRATVGLLKAIFTMPYQKDGVTKDALYFNQLLQDSNSFEELALNLRNAIGTSKFGDEDHKIPPELLADQEDKEIHLLSSLAGLQEGMEEKDVNGQKVQVPDGHFDIFNVDQLDFDVSSAKFDNSGNSDLSLAEQLNTKDGSPKLYKLMSLLLDGSDEEISKVLKQALPESTGTEKVTMNDNGKSLANFLLKAIKDKESSFTQYSGYEEGSDSDFATMVSDRKALIDFSEKNNLGIYDKDEMLSFYHQNEYEQMLKDFAMSLRHVEPLLKSEKAFYRVPEDLSVDYRIPENETSVSAIADSFTEDLAYLQTPESQETFDWFNQIVNSNFGFNSNLILANIFGDYDEEVGSNKSPFNLYSQNLFGMDSTRLSDNSFDFSA